MVIHRGGAEEAVEVEEGEKGEMEEEAGEFGARLGVETINRRRRGGRNFVGGGRGANATDGPRMSGLALKPA